MSLPPVTTVRVDFNWVREGFLRAFVDDADAPVEPGAVVQVVDEDGTERSAFVHEIVGDTLQLLVLPDMTLDARQSVAASLSTGTAAAALLGLHERVAYTTAAVAIRVISSLDAGGAPLTGNPYRGAPVRLDRAKERARA